MKILIAILLLASSNAFAANAFDNFLGNYYVVDQKCSGPEGCDRTAVNVGYDGNTLRLYEIYPQGSSGFPIYEKSEQGDYGYTKATVTGDANHAEWIYQQRIRQFAGPELTEIDEARTLDRKGDTVYYFFYHREKRPLSGEWSISRNYTLKKK